MRAHILLNTQSLSCVNSLQPHGLQPTRLLCPWNFPSKYTGRVAIFSQGIFPGLEPMSPVPPALAGGFFTTVSFFTNKALTALISPGLTMRKYKMRKILLRQKVKKCLKNCEDRSKGHRNQLESAVTKLNNLTIKINYHNRLKPTE